MNTPPVYTGTYMYIAGFTKTTIHAELVLTPDAVLQSLSAVYHCFISLYVMQNYTKSLQVPSTVTLLKLGSYHLPCTGMNKSITIVVSTYNIFKKAKGPKLSLI